MNDRATFTLGKSLGKSTRHGPSTPVLASTIFKQPSRSVNLDTGTGEQHHLSTSLPSLDTSVLLVGGFAYGNCSPGGSLGEIVSVAFEDGSRSPTSSVFVHSLLAAHLVPSSPLPSATSENAAFKAGPAFYIDTTGDFSVHLLRELLVQRLRLQQRPGSGGQTFTHSGGYVYSAVRTEKNATKGDEQLQQEAERLLEKVSYMRVLDFAGILEAIGEIQDEIGCGGVAASDGTQVKATRPTSNNTTIADSQRDSDEDEDMIDWPASPAPEAVPEAAPEVGHETNPSSKKTQSASTGPPLILLPSLSTHLTPQMHSRYVHAHALLVHLMRSLRCLCQPPLSACVIITNATVSVSAHGAHARRDAADCEQRGPSAFEAKAHLKPALGRTYAQLVDLSLLVTLWKRDGNACVVEVLEDAKGANMAVGKHRLSPLFTPRQGRAGKWAVFSVADGTLREMQ